MIQSINPGTYRFILVLQNCLAVGWLFFFITPLVFGQPQASNPTWSELKNSGQSAFPAPLSIEFPADNWWEQLHDPYLNTYISAALAANSSLKAATNRIDEAKALVQETRSMLRPTISVAPEYERLRFPTNFITSAQPVSNIRNLSAGQAINLYSFPLEASYELDLFGKNRLKVKSAQKTEEETVLQQRVIRLSIAAQTASAYLNLVQTDAMIQTTQALIDNLKLDMELLQQLYLQGLIPYDNILLTEQNLAQYRESLAQDISQQATFAHQLSILANMEPQSQEHLKRSILDCLRLPAPIPVGIPSQLVTHRPDIVQAELAMQKAHIDVREARKEFLPSLTLTGQVGFLATNLSKLFNWNSRLYIFTATLLQNLYTGGYKTAYLKYQKAVMLEQLNNYRTVLLNAFQDVENSLSLLKANYSVLQQNWAEMDSAKTFFDLAQIRLNTGIGTRLDLLSTQRQFLSYQLLAQQNRGRSLIDFVSLNQALGGGYIPQQAGKS